MEVTKQAKHHSFKEVTLENLPDELGVMEATFVSGCSTHFITNAIKAGELKAERIPIKKRLVWRIQKEDFLDFHAKRVYKNGRLNHLKHRVSNRRSTVSRGYRKVYVPKHPRSDLHGYVFEHIVVYEKHTKKKVPYGKDIHHINGDRLDNRFKNLELCESRGAHLKKHAKQHSIRMKLEWLLSSKRFNKKTLSDDQKLALMNALLDSIKKR